MIADEAHRSQYDFIDGFARHMRDALPNASFIGFTGTPIELTDRTRARSSATTSTSTTSSRRSRTGPRCRSTTRAGWPSSTSDEERSPRLDAEFEEVTEGEEVERKEKLKTKWAALEAVVGDREARRRSSPRTSSTTSSSGWRRWTARRMVVCMSRRICVDLYDAIVELRPTGTTTTTTRARSRS